MGSCARSVNGQDYEIDYKVASDGKITITKLDPPGLPDAEKIVREKCMNNNLGSIPLPGIHG